ncbi:hypothetical protein H2203_004927 [Taxawa tesnikishii (nom. ined.)]|nr:hypothetical protein H2203_004927 [Dothideales sp. JES 119]
MVHLDVPGADNGFFSTEEEPLQKSPNLAAGFKSLDLSCEAAVRANLVVDNISTESFKITLETWGTSTLYSASATWIEHRARARECFFGQFDTQDLPKAAQKAASGASKPAAKPPPQENSKQIKFPRALDRDAEVVCWLNRIDMASGEDRNYRVHAYATHVTSEGFTAHIDTWSDTMLNGAAMCWIAFPKDKQLVASGSFSTGDVRSWSNPKPKNSARVSFKQGKFAKPPTVLVALNMLDMAGNSDLRVKVDADEVTEEGFRWHLDTWEDSTLYAAGASWVALGFV